MVTNILSTVICTEFDKFRNGHVVRDAVKKGVLSPTDEGLLVRFDLHPNYEVEDGYRHLEIFVYGGGSNYIGVFAKIDWNVLPVINDITTPVSKNEFIREETSWVCRGKHDSCWRDSIQQLLFEYRERLETIDNRFGKDWYRIWKLEQEEAQLFYDLVEEYRNYDKRPKTLVEQELQFKTATEGITITELNEEPSVAELVGAAGEVAFIANNDNGVWGRLNLALEPFLKDKEAKLNAKASPETVAKQSRLPTGMR